MDAPEPPKSFAQRLQEKLAASRFFTFSLLIHVVIVIMCGSVVLIKNALEAPDFEASAGGLVEGSEQVAAPPEMPPDVTQTFTPDTPQVSAPSLNAISTTNMSTPTFQVAAAAAPVVKPVQSDAMSKALENASKAMAKGAGGGGIPGTMAGRMGGTSRQRMMDMNGGKKKSEEAVMRGLRWLVKNQSPDGSWSPANKPAMTGLALLCFLGHGETTTSPEFGPNVQKAVDYCIAFGTKGQGKLGSGNSISGGPQVYEHAILAYALGEYYTMTKDDRVAPLLQQAIGYIVKGQGPDGGWEYGYVPTEKGGDTSVSGWQIQALKAAHLSQLNIEGVDAALDKAMLNLKRVQGPKGGFGYHDAASERYSLTGVGVLCTYFWKQDKDALVRDGIKYILDDDQPKVDYKGEKANLYAWYYNTQACLMVGGSHWGKWNRMFQDQITDAQRPDGSWPPTGNPKPLGPEIAPDGAGPFYRTTLCVLMLEVYYRYMPVTKG